MIVCSCNFITDKEIRSAIEGLRQADPFCVITPGSIYRMIGKRPVCGSCLPLVTKLILLYDTDAPTRSAHG
jgi:bacterioferritin-associated ferredoxin